MAYMIQATTQQDIDLLTEIRALANADGAKVSEVIRRSFRRELKAAKVKK